jgi:hypothetical protein
VSDSDHRIIVGELPAIIDLKPEQPPYAALKHGDVVWVRYTDHVLFKDGDASDYEPWTRETIGWLDQVGSDYIRIVWERHWDKTQRGSARSRSTGLTVAKKLILELGRISR